MFVIEILEDKVKAQPDQFDRCLRDVIMEQIELKYVNKIILRVGLCVAFYDFIEIGDPYIYPAEGSTHQSVKFRLVFFRPFDGETLTGKIIGSDEKGIRVSLGFFDDIFIPSNRFMDNSVYDEKKGLWIWRYGEPPDQNDFIMEIDEQIRFKVLATQFSNDEALKNEIKAQNSFKINASAGSQSAAVSAVATPEACAMKIVGGIQDFGLGLTSWW
jgi:DNA-directed RNA polymerase III subunit RPC8